MKKFFEDVGSGCEIAITGGTFWMCIYCTIMFFANVSSCVGWTAVGMFGLGALGVALSAALGIFMISIGRNAKVGPTKKKQKEEEKDKIEF